MLANCLVACHAETAIFCFGRLNNEERPTTRKEQRLACRSFATPCHSGHKNMSVQLILGEIDLAPIALGTAFHQRAKFNLFIVCKDFRLSVHILWLWNVKPEFDLFFQPKSNNFLLWKARQERQFANAHPIARIQHWISAAIQQRFTAIFQQPGLCIGNAMDVGVRYRFKRDGEVLKQLTFVFIRSARKKRHHVRHFSSKD